MPELPEVETVRRQLAPLLHGRVIAGATVRWPRLVRSPGAASFTRRVRGLRFGEVRRHGKILFFDLGGGHVLLSHLGMTGGFRVLSARDPRPLHTIASFRLDDGSELAYIDPRRFGRMRLARDAELGTLPELRGIGPDPLSDEFTADRLGAILGSTRRMIRECLLDQRRVAGLGNIYVAEALFLAGIDPRTPSSRLDRARVARLHAEIRALLSLAVEWKGSTILSYRDSEGNRGGFADRLSVYGREGEPCSRCGGAIRKETRSGRSSFFCPRCQRRGSRKRA